MREEYKSSRTKVGIIRIDKYKYKPIWAQVCKNYWTNYRMECLLTINFNQGELETANNLYYKLTEKEIDGQKFDIRHMTIHRDYQYRGIHNSFKKEYVKVLINIDTKKISLKKVLDMLTKSRIKHTTTYNFEIDDIKIEKFKSKSLAEML